MELIDAAKIGSRVRRDRGPDAKLEAFREIDTTVDGKKRATLSPVALSPLARGKIIIAVAGGSLIITIYFLKLWVSRIKQSVNK